MRIGVILVLLWFLNALQAQPDKTGLGKRFGILVNEDIYPQKTPEAALKSVVKAIESRRINYLMAHLADPKFVDKKVAEYKKPFQGPEEARELLAFDRLVKETDRYFLEDPYLVQELKRFAKEGEWKTGEAETIASVKELPGRQVFMRKVQNRWFLENKQK